jgi:hypothetical protein
VALATLCPYVVPQRFSHLRMPPKVQDGRALNLAARVVDQDRVAIQVTGMTRRSSAAGSNALLLSGVLLTIVAWILIVRASDFAFPMGLSDQDKVLAVQGRHDLLVGFGVLAVASLVHLAAGARWAAGATGVATGLGLAADLASPTDLAYFDLVLLPLIGICVAGLVVDRVMSRRRRCLGGSGQRDHSTANWRRSR